jgi:diguanylate cyclase (GGDEF)-like protein/PAS domain S-box-containing protein
MFTMDCDLATYHPKILIVDDDESAVLEMRTLLKNLGEVHTATTGEEALSKVEEIKPDIMLLDIEMPGLDGFEVCQQLRKNPETRHIGIIFVTAHAQLDNQLASLELGAVDFIAKPISHQVCKLRVRNLLQIQTQSKQLFTAKQEILHLVSQVPSFISYWDKDWNNLFSNDNFGEWFGFTQADLLRQHLSLIFPKQVIEAMAHCLPDTNGRYELTASFEVGMNNERHYIIRWTETDYHGYKNGYLMTLTDITQQKQVEYNLQEQKDFFNIILGSVAEGVIATDDRGLVSFINPKAELITGWRQIEALNKPVEQVMQLRDPETKVNTENPIRVALRQQRITSMPLNTQLVARDGRLSQVEQTAAPIRSYQGQMTGAVAVIHDISHTVSLSLLRNQASSYDQLTNVANRLFIREKLQLSCDAVKVSDIQMAMAVIDVDHFKFFNDAHGNGTGDAVLRGMARRLFENYEPDDSVGRLGADEFMVIFRDLSTQDALEKELHLLLDLLRTPITVDDEKYSLSVSIGVSMIDKRCSDPDTVMQQADAALYRAKFEGGDRYLIFSEELERTLMQRRSTEELLRNSLADKSMIEVHYQPKVDMTSGRTIGAEALVRIKDYAGKLISPAEFIPIAEESSLIVQLGAVVMQSACEQCSRWEELGYSIPVSVNISAVQCLNGDLVNLVKDCLYVSKLNPAMLELEVTETAFIRNFDETLSKFNELKQMGVKLAIDDFGKGYSNLTYLRRLDVDKLKLDMSYVKGMLTNQRDYEIVKTIINLGQSMSLDLIAEGVESTEHRDELIKLGCHYGQGYLYARPLPEDQFTEYLNTEYDIGRKA